VVFTELNVSRAELCQTLLRSTDMACYFGCSTGTNKCAYFWWFALVLSGAGCLLGWYFNTKSCIDQARVCLERNNVTASGLFSSFSLEDAHTAFRNNLSGEDVCHLFFGDSAIDSTQIRGCAECYAEVQPCFGATLGVFIAGIVLFGASFLSVFFCCCCASAPHEKYYP